MPRSDHRRAVLVTTGRALWVLIAITVALTAHSTWRWFQ